MIRIAIKIISYCHGEKKNIAKKKINNPKKKRETKINKDIYIPFIS
jgi:hypothetical protein